MKKGTLACCVSLALILACSGRGPNGVGANSDGGVGTPVVLAEGPDASKGKAIEFGMKMAVASAVSLRAALDAGDGGMIALWARRLSQGGSSSVGQALTVEGSAGKVFVAESNVPACTANRCLYSNFFSDGITIDGEISWVAAGAEAKKVVWQLVGKGPGVTGDVGIVAGITEFTLHLNGEITVSSSELDGRAGQTTNGSGGEGANKFFYEQGNLMKFDHVTLAQGCATGGDIYAKTWTKSPNGTVVAYEDEAPIRGCN